MGRLSDVRVREWLRAGTPLAGKSDGGGLTFTLSAAGRAVWTLRYRYGGRRRELTLGAYPDVSLKEARRRAALERARVAAGVDVAGEKRREKLAQAAARTFRDLAEDYFTRTAPGLAERTRRETRRYLDKDLLPRLGPLAIANVTPAEVVAFVERLAARSATVARRAFEILSVIFTHGVAKHLAAANPCASLKVSAILGVQPPRRPRVMLTEAELGVLLARLPALGAENALAVKILLATCTRKGELLRARWEHLDLARGLWTIPKESSKTGRGFVVPLASPVVRWFETLRPLAGESAYVLPARVHGAGHRDRPIHASTLNLTLARLAEPLRGASPHDLRSTARSYLAKQGVPVIVAERCLNHRLGGLVDVYDKHDYLDERRHALEVWAGYLERLEQGARWNVIPLRAGAVA